ncbi:Rbr-type e3 ubiquitin transferase [Thalictrum thalictroides]|uniref:RBR-type E3 ubiquitin transferase n=1 Tax=Thalictrum thalictroides TaxID=46969 RepID=A0A7J6WBS2_THATH|nr:Rbr-type e3 ubiquitin transferase [Thalictrum thalictroides]
MVENGLSFTCEICVEPVSSYKRFKSNKNCVHRSYCLDCIAKYIEVKIQEYNMSEIKCPGLECTEVLDPLRCRSILPVRVFESWCDALCETTLLQWQRVYCPYSDCSALILNECGSNVVKTKCPNCKRFLCYKCGVPWHPGYRCNETGQFRGQNDFLLCQLMNERKWRRCPACSHGVELRSGCKFVRCRCGTIFCHACGRKRSREWCWCKTSVTQNLKFSAILALALMLASYCLWMGAIYMK